MPYIPQQHRDDIEPDILYGARSSGDLTFQLSAVVLRYLGDEPRFSDFADAIAALECAKLELYRRSVAPYETKKASENGDLPWPYRGE